MSTELTSPEELSAAESSLGRVLALIHRVLPRLDEPGRAAEVQAAFRRAAEFLETGRRAHDQANAPRSAAGQGANRLPDGVAPEIAAVIAAAVSIILDRPYRIVSVQQVVAPPVPHINVWAFEGRTQIFQSHKVR